MTRLGTIKEKKAGKEALEAMTLISDGKCLNVSDGVDLIAKELGNLLALESIHELLAA